MIRYVIRARLLLIVLLPLACSSAQPPAGPKYVPTKSAEAETACPKERAKAQEARELLLGEDLSADHGSALQKSAAEAVLAHGQCEAMAFQSLPPAQGNHDQILTTLRGHREQVQTANHLLEEVARYKDAGLRMRADMAKASLKLTYAKKVAAVQPPADLDARTRMEFESELSSASQVLRMEAVAILEPLMESIKSSPGVSELLPEACEIWQAARTGSNESCP